MGVTDICRTQRVANAKRCMVLAFLLAAVSAKAQLFAGGSGTAGDPYQISTAAELNNIRNNRGTTNSFKYYRQTVDIDIASITNNWEPIGNLGVNQPACVHYDGGSNRIFNLHISRSSANYIGLFGYLLGSVRNVSLESGSIAGNTAVGALVGRLEYGSISNCQSLVSVSGSSQVGGLVGANIGGTVRNVAVRGGVISGSSIVGGLVGFTSGGSLSHSFASSVMIGGTNTGGLIGFAAPVPVVTACYWDMQVSGYTATAGNLGTGLMTSNMWLRASFSGWDFNNVWQLYSGKSYPYLRALADDAATPVLTPASGTFPGTSVTVTATCATAGATMHYSIGRTAPTDLTTNTVAQGGSIAVPVEATLNVVAWKAYMNPSPLSTATHTPAPLAYTPSADPGAGAYPGTNLVVVLSSITTNSTIRYTTNGNDPTETNAWVVSGGAVNVPIPGVLTARAYRSDLNRSEPLEVAYTNAALAATPTFSPTGGVFAGSSVSVTVTCAVAVDWIRYTTDGSEPTSSSLGSTSNVVVLVPLPGTLKARAFRADLNDSLIQTGTYANAASVAIPVFNPDGGTFAGSSATVTVTCETAGADIRYTTDTTEPTEGSLGVSSGGAVMVPVPGTLKARVFKSGLNPSTVRSALYENAGNTATPTFNPASGPIAAGVVKVAMSSTTPSATIRYTTDGSDPTETNAFVMSGMSVTVPVPGSVRAKAWSVGLNPSTVSSASYFTAGVVAKPSFNPDGGTGAVSVVLSCGTSGALIHYTTDGADPTASSPSVSTGTSVPVSAPSTLKAKAFKAGLFPSPVNMAYFGAFAGGSGTVQDPYRIANALHLDKVRYHLGSTFVVIADIDLGVVPWNSGEGWLPLGADYNGTLHAQGLAGVFDGQGYVISNLFVNRPTMNEVAVFGYVGDSGSIRNLGIISGSVAGKTSVGGLVGYNDGSLSNCFSRCSVVGLSRVGGLIGETAYASDCMDSFSTGSVAASGAGSYFGGLVGYASQAQVNRCYAAGAVATNAFSGGLIGYQLSSTITASYWDMQASGHLASAGGAGAMGRTTEQMWKQVTFAGWNFAAVWRIDEGLDYPQLRDGEPLASSSPPVDWLTRFYGSVEASPEASIREWPLYWEYIAGTDPTDPFSVFAVNGTDGFTTNLTLQVNSLTGRVYRLLSTPSLGAGANWQPVSGVAAQDGTGGSLNLSAPLPATRTYYRVSVELAE